MTPDWLAQEEREEARRIALDRRARFERERAERLAEYGLAWDRLFAEQRKQAATTRRERFYVVSE